MCFEDFTNVFLSMFLVENQSLAIVLSGAEREESLTIVLSGAEREEVWRYGAEGAAWLRRAWTPWTPV